LKQLSANVSHLEASCDSPPELKGKNLNRIQLSEFKCKAPEIIEEPNDEQMLNTPISLNCKARGDPEPSIVWLHNDNPIDMKYEQNHYSILDNGTKLMIKQRSNRIEGTYQCVARDSAGSKSSKQDVVRFAKYKPKINSVETKKVPKAIGTNLLLNCLKSLDVVWSFNDSNINYLDSNRYELMTNGSLLIRNLLPIDKGFFKCSDAQHQTITNYKVRVSGEY